MSFSGGTLSYLIFVNNPAIMKATRFKFQIYEIVHPLYDYGMIMMLMSVVVVFININ